MKHRILCLFLALTFVLTALAACSGNSGDSKKQEETESPSQPDYGDPSGHPLYIRAAASCETVTASFTLSQNADSSAAVLDMEKIGDEGDTAIYRCYQDPAAYDRVVIRTDGRESDRLAFNAYTSGWELDPGRELPFTYGEKSESPQVIRKEFPYQERTKGVLIWTPKNYDATSSEKYSVIYMTDGHNLFDPNATSTGSWAVAESIEAMMAQSDHKAIIVGIENMDGWRDDELTPDIGETLSADYQDGHGDYFCEFVISTVMPYVEENYNIYTDREHTAMCGSSSGGIESFYIAMQHPERFGTVGALSPAFSIFDTPVWQDYLSEKDFSAGYPRIYLYCGKGDDLEKMLYPGFDSMPDTLVSAAGYPTENIRSCDEEKAVHNELYWRILFPDFLRFMFD